MSYPGPHILIYLCHTGTINAMVALGLILNFCFVSPSSNNGMHFLMKVLKMKSTIRFCFKNSSISISRHNLYQTQQLSRTSDIHSNKTICGRRYSKRRIHFSPSNDSSSKKVPSLMPPSSKLQVPPRTNKRKETQT